MQEQIHTPQSGGITNSTGQLTACLSSPPGLYQGFRARHSFCSLPPLPHTVQQLSQRHKPSPPCTILHILPGSLLQKGHSCYPPDLSTSLAGAWNSKRLWLPRVPSPWHCTRCSLHHTAVPLALPNGCYLHGMRGAWLWGPCNLQVLPFPVSSG